MAAAATAEAQVAAPIPVEAPAAETVAHEMPIDDWESMMSVEAAPAAEPAAISIDVAPPAAEVPAAEAPVADFAISVEAPAAAEPAAFDVTPSADGAAVAEFSFGAEPAAAPAAAIEIPVPEPAPAPPVVQAPPPPPPPAPPVIAKPAPAAKAPVEDDDLLGDLVSDLEESLGDSFLESKPQPAKAAPAPPVVQAPPPSAMPAAAASAAAPAPAPAKPAPAAAQQDAASALSDLFDEFKEDAEVSAGEAEDPDTHYNLGIAFKEMGLLDEAIGELQKVAKAIDQGHPFAQQMQAYTWLAQCLVDKGVPQAAVRWYERALKVPDINEESRLAVYYDLGNAHEVAGDRKKAHDTFLEVYSANIDYRDVADRIKALKN
jgi:hypothetical protein